MDGCILTEHTLSQGAGQRLLSGAGPELKSVTSSSDAGMADYRTRWVDEAGSNGKESNSCASLKQIRPSLY